MELTPEQHAAVAHAGGPALVLAGAGAGKTRVLCERLAWLVAGGAAPAEVLALTFSREAAIELRQRAEERIGTAHATLRVSTFHAFAQDLVRIHGVERGLVSERRVATAEDRSLMLLDRLAELDLRHHDLRGDAPALVARLIGRIDACRDQLVTPEQFLGWSAAAVREARTPSAEQYARRDQEFARVLAAHDGWLDEAGLEDFGLSIVRAIDLLRTHPDRLTAVRAETRHLLVDEFQDTNHAQSVLLHLVGEGADSLMVVGDDDQGIYRFRGASTKNMADFREAHPGCAELRLTLNHRSGQGVLDAAGAVVEPIADRVPKRLVALPEAPSPVPQFWSAADPDEQARAVVDDIRRRAQEGIPLEEQAILMRAVRTESRPVVAALERAGVPHQVRGGLRLLERREVREAIAWLRAACRPDDVAAHLRIAADPRFGLPWERAADAVSSAPREAVSAALVGVAREAGASAFAEAFDSVGRAAAGLTAPAALRVAIDATGLRGAALALGGAEGAARVAGLAGLERLAETLTERDPGMDARALADMLTGLAELGFRGESGTPAERTGVQVMTIHQAKGLEFDAVYVVGLTRTAFPGRDRGRGSDLPDALVEEAIARGRDAHVDEARRLLYVAMTRARRHLVLSTLQRADAGTTQHPSPFFEEARAAVAAPLEELGVGPEREALAEVSLRQAAFTEATMRAAQSVAAGDGDAADLMAGVEARARQLVAARADALAGTPPEPVAAPPRPARPGLALSPSGIGSYLTCPRRYRYAAVDRVPVSPGVQQRIGTAAHSALEGHYRPGGTGGDGDHLVARFAAVLRDRDLADTAEGRQALAHARERLPAYHQRVLTTGVRPIGVEVSFTLTVGPHRVRGRIDRIDEHPRGGHQLVDYKTGKPPSNPEQRDERTMNLYLLGAREALGIEARGAEVVHILDGDVRGVHPDGGSMAETVETV
ncbi:MAG: ATP-dependent DNA helicase, partial [Miltoncostaeaceae bacterium]